MSRSHQRTADAYQSVFNLSNLNRFLFRVFQFSHSFAKRKLVWIKPWVQDG